MKNGKTLENSFSQNNNEGNSVTGQNKHVTNKQNVTWRKCIDEDVVSIESISIVPQNCISLERMSSLGEQVRKMDVRRLCSLGTQVREVGKSLESIYDATVSVADNYTHHKRKQNKKHCVRYLLSKTFGIPLALLYGFVLIWIVSDIILGQSGTRVRFSTESGLTIARNFCAQFLSSKKKDENSSKPLPLVFSSLKTGNKSSLTHPDNRIFNKSLFTFQTIRQTLSPMFDDQTSDGDGARRIVFFDTVSNSASNKTSGGFLFQNDSIELYIVVGIITGLLGFLSVFSRNMKSAMLLILPGLITQHSRHVIYSIVLGFLANAPLNNMRSNLNKLIENATHIYKWIIVVACVREKKFVSDLHKTHETLAQMKTLQDQMICSYLRQLGQPCATREFPPFSGVSNNILHLLTSLNANGSQALKQQTNMVMENIDLVGSYLEIGRKVLTVLSLIMLVVDAVRYLRSYYCDSSFDNMYVGGATMERWRDVNNNKDSDEDPFLKNLFQNVGWDDKTGLRRWEISLGLKTWNNPKFTRKELLKIIRNSMITVLFTFFIVIVLGVDYFLAETVMYMNDGLHLNQTLVQFNTSQENDLLLQLQEYDGSYHFVPPDQTTSKSYLGIASLLLAAMASCALEVLMSRGRANLCRLFFPDREMERSDYLYYRIITGRITRMYNFHLIMRQEQERQRKLLRFSPLQRLHRTIPFLRNRKVQCSGCGWKTEKSKENGYEHGPNFCNECELDRPKSAEDYRKSIFFEETFKLHDDDENVNDDASTA